MHRAPDGRQDAENGPRIDFMDGTIMERDQPKIEPRLLKEFERWLDHALKILVEIHPGWPNFFDKKQLCKDRKGKHGKKES